MNKKMYINNLFSSSLIGEEVTTVINIYPYKEYEMQSEIFLKFCSLLDKSKQTLDSSDFTKEELKILLASGLISDSPFKEIPKYIKNWIDHNWHESLIYHSKVLDLENNFEDDSVVKRSQQIERRNKRLTPQRTNILQFYKRYDDMDTLKIPLIKGLGPLEEKDYIEAINTRRSNESFNCKMINLKELSALLYHSFSEIREKLENNYKKLNDSDDLSELYNNSHADSMIVKIIISESEDILCGMYDYDIRNHTLLLQKKGDFRKEVQNIVIGQRKVLKSGFSIFLGYNFNNLQIRYSNDKVYRNALTLLGETMQEILISASALDYSMFITPAVMEKEMENLFEKNIFEDMYLYMGSFG